MNTLLLNYIFVAKFITMHEHVSNYPTKLARIEIVSNMEYACMPFTLKSSNNLNIRMHSMPSNLIDSCAI